MHIAEKLGNELLAVVDDNFDYFKKNPPHLAWAMMHYELIYRITHDPPNPKDSILKQAEKLSVDDGDLLYDAWAVTVSHGYEFSDTNPNLALESKQNKTMDDWIALLQNPHYRFKDLFPDNFFIESHLLCSYGTGLDWNKEGFIAEIGPSGIETVIFSGYTRIHDSMDYCIKQKIKEVLSSDPDLEKRAECFMQESSYVAERINSGEEWIYAVNPNMKKMNQEMNQRREELQKLFNKLPSEIREESGLGELFLDKKIVSLEERVYYPLSEYSPLVTMPENAHESYVSCGIKIAQKIMANPQEPDQSKLYAHCFLEMRV